MKAMNVFMNKVALQTFSYFDIGKNPSDMEPERFYHGFVLGDDGGACGQICTDVQPGERFWTV